MVRVVPGLKNRYQGGIFSHFPSPRRKLVISDPFAILLPLGMFFSVQDGGDHYLHSVFRFVRFSDTWLDGSGPMQSMPKFQWCQHDVSRKFLVLSIDVKKQTLLWDDPSKDVASTKSSTEASQESPHCDAVRRGDSTCHLTLSLLREGNGGCFIRSIRRDPSI